MGTFAIISKMKTGLVLEGGGMRGIFTAGIIDVLLQHDIIFDGVIGVSAGSSFGCNYVSRQQGRVLRYNLRYCRDPRYMGLLSLLVTGNIVGAEFSYHKLPMQLDRFDIETFESSPTQFHIVCTDVATGQPVYQHIRYINYNSLEWLRASASMPILSRPVKVDDGRHMLDGGISDSIPLAHFQSLGFERNLVILTQPRDYRKTPVPAWLFRTLMPRTPMIAEAMIKRHIMYNSQLDYIAGQEKLGNTLIIAPEKSLEIGRLEMSPKKIRLIYQQGVDSATSMLDKIKTFLTT